MQKFKVTFVAFNLLAISWLQSGCASAPKEPPAKWLTDFPAAKAQAKAEGKLIFLDFEGSDWCVGCMELNRDVFPTDKFAGYARTNLVLVSVDFPENKDLPPTLKKANDALSHEYKVDGVPTLMLLNADGQELGRMAGVLDEKAEDLVAWLEKLKRAH